MRLSEIGQFIVRHAACRREPSTAKALRTPQDDGSSTVHGVMNAAWHGTGCAAPPVSKRIARVLGR